MKVVKRSICKELCKDCPVMERCKDCFDCNDCPALKIYNIVCVSGYARPNECFCMRKVEDNEHNKTCCSLKQIIMKGVGTNG